MDFDLPTFENELDGVLADGVHADAGNWFFF
jgi:hypothetical protein